MIKCGVCNFLVIRFGKGVGGNLDKHTPKRKTMHVACMCLNWLIAGCEIRGIHFTLF